MMENRLLENPRRNHTKLQIKLTLSLENKPNVKTLIETLNSLETTASLKTCLVSWGVSCKLRIRRIMEFKKIMAKSTISRRTFRKVITPHQALRKTSKSHQ
jgi:hypothetical protein